MAATLAICLSGRAVNPLNTGQIIDLHFHLPLKRPFSLHFPAGVQFLRLKKNKQKHTHTLKIPANTNASLHHLTWLRTVSPLKYIFFNPQCLFPCSLSPSLPQQKPPHTYKNAHTHAHPLHQYDRQGDKMAEWWWRSFVFLYTSTNQPALTCVNTTLTFSSSKWEYCPTDRREKKQQFSYN